jgi:hypothetical protein
MTDVFPNVWALLAIGSLWTVWFFVLCGERGWFCRKDNYEKTMGPLTRAGMVVMFTFYTVTAQKPANMNGGGTNATLPAAAPQYTESVFPPPADGDAQQAAPSETQAAVQSEPLYEISEPSRVVFQSTPASDPRTAVAFAGEPGWGMPAAVAVTPGLAALSFGGGGTNTRSPVRFSGTAAVTVRTLILAARGDAADLATLVDAPEMARLRIAAAGGQEPEMSASERSLTGQFLPGRWLNAAVDFETPANLSGLFFGGSAGRPVWSRNWRGEVAEIVGFDTPPDADVRAGVANYLAIRWGFGGYPATPEQRQAAVAAGLDCGFVWGTVFIVK